MSRDTLIEAREALHVAKLALLNIRLLWDVEQARETSPEIARIVETRISADHVAQPVSLLHQASFLQLAYICLVWLWERAGADRQQGAVAQRAAKHFDFAGVLQTAAGPRQLSAPNDVLRLLRNAISHARVKAGDGTFDFSDWGRNEDEPTRVELSWRQLGQLSEAVLLTMNELLWPPNTAPGGLGLGKAEALEGDGWSINTMANRHPRPATGSGVVNSAGAIRMG